MRNLFTILFQLVLFNLFAQDFDQSKMDSLFDRLDRYHRSMGSVSLFQDGKEVYSRSIGYADIEKGIQANHETQYRIGSISKIFTAVMIMQLVEKEVLNLDQKLSDFHPEIPSAEKISIEHLLRHQSGIYNFTNDEEYLNFMVNPMSKKELIEKIASYEREFEPGEQTKYSNSNYVLLTFILEEASGKSYPLLLKEQIIDQLELKNTAYGDKIESEKNEAHSYTPGNPWIKSEETDMSIPLGAGGIVSTPTDLNLFLDGLFNQELVLQSSLDSMMKLEGRYGLGIFPVPFYDKNAYGHTGGIDAFISNAFYFPEEKVSIAYTSNAQRTAVNDIMIGVLSIYFNKEYTLPEYHEAVQLTEEDLKPLLGVYSSPTFPLKITISHQGNILYAQATGQPSFALEAIGPNQFQYEAAKLKMTFNAEEGQMQFEQMGMKYELTKE